MTSETKDIVFYILMFLSIAFPLFVFITRYLDRHNDHHHDDDDIDIDDFI